MAPREFETAGQNLLIIKKIPFGSSVLSPNIFLPKTTEPFMPIYFLVSVSVRRPPLSGVSQAGELTARKFNINVCQT